MSDETMCVCGHALMLHHGSAVPGFDAIPDGQCSGCDCNNPRLRPADPLPEQGE